MYIPDHFRMPDGEVIPFLEEHPFGTLVTSGDGLKGTPLPFIVEQKEPLRIQLHIARVNSMEAHLDKADAILIVNGEHAYISPVAYDRLTAPTWNYRSVHCHGQLVQLDDSATLSHLKNLVEKFEAPFGRSNLFSKIPTVDALLPHLSAFEMQVTRIEAASKMSQNHSSGDIDRIVRQLEEQGSQEKKVAEIMKANRSNS